MRISPVHPCVVFSLFSLILLGVGCQGLFEDLDSLKPSSSDEVSFSVEIDEAASTLAAAEGEPITIVAEISNQGSATSTQDIVLFVDDQAVSRREAFEVNAGSTGIVILEWVTEPGDAGQHVAEVQSDDDRASIIVTVSEGEVTDEAHFAVAIVDEDSTLFGVPGEPVTIVSEVTNQESYEAVQDIRFEIRSNEESELFYDDERALSLAGDSSAIVEFHWTPGSNHHGQFQASISSDDDSDSRVIHIAEPDDFADVDGILVDAEDSQPLPGVTVDLLDMNSQQVARTTTSQGGAFQFTNIPTGQYEVLLSAPGLEPTHTISGSSGQEISLLNIFPGMGPLTLNLEWKRQFDLIMTSGRVQFLEPLPSMDYQFRIEMPQCVYDDGEWKIDETIWQSASPDYSIHYDEVPGCYRVESIDIDIATGELHISREQAYLPKLDVYIASGSIDPFNYLAIDWSIDEISGELDFEEGHVEIAIDTRILLSGVANNQNFGTSQGELDCQLTGGWGGSDPENPQEDTENEQEGEFLHHPMEIQLTTGDLTVFGNTFTGATYDPATSRFRVIDNRPVIDSIFESSQNSQRACGRDLSIDVGKQVNEELFDLPRDPYDTQWEFTFELY